MTVTVHHGDCREVLATLAEASVDSVVCDPPYHLTSIHKRFAKTAGADRQPGTEAYGRLTRGFMGKTWDGGDVSFQPETWAAVLRVMKPGAHLVAFGGTRTYHRMVCAIEDAGFEVRDQIGWLYGSGFPKSHNIGDGWGTALKPAWEPIVLARKPFKGTVAANVLAHGTGALNIDGCRVDFASEDDQAAAAAATAAQRLCHDAPGHVMKGLGGTTGFKNPRASLAPYLAKMDKGRWPANVILSYPEDEYLLRPDASREQKAELYRWMSENA